MSCSVTGILLSLSFYTEDPGGVRGKVSIFLLTDLSLSTGSESAVVARRRNTTLYIRTITTFADTATLLQCQKVDPIIRRKAAVSMIDQGELFLEVIMCPMLALNMRSYTDCVYLHAEGG